MAQRGGKPYDAKPQIFLLDWRRPSILLGIPLAVVGFGACFAMGAGMVVLVDATPLVFRFVGGALAVVSAFMLANVACYPIPGLVFLKLDRAGVTIRHWPFLPSRHCPWDAVISLELRRRDESTKTIVKPRALRLWHSQPGLRNPLDLIDIFTIPTVELLALVQGKVGIGIKVTVRD
jgi:hypothetical protein